MTAPVGAAVKLYVDLAARVAVDDVIETTSGRRYQVLGVRVQQRGKHAGRQHLQCLVLGDQRLGCIGTIDVAPSNRVCQLCDTAGQTCARRLHQIRWYPRRAGKRRRDASRRGAR